MLLGICYSLTMNFNSGDFVEAHNLRLGDFIMLYKDDEGDRYVLLHLKCHLCHLTCPSVPTKTHALFVADYSCEEGKRASGITCSYRRWDLRLHSAGHCGGKRKVLRPLFTMGWQYEHGVWPELCLHIRLLLELSRWTFRRKLFFDRGWICS